MKISTIPQLGFGTYGRRGNDGIAALEYALEVGYRHLDTAQNYNTEAECGQALINSGLARGEVHMTTKIDTPNFGDGKLIPSLRQSLDTMQLDYVDLCLIHWPSPNGEIDLPVYMEQIAQAQELGLAKQIGVSNFTVDLLTQSKAILGDVQMATNQVEVHPYLQNDTLVDFCATQGISVTCYRPIFGGSALYEDAVISRIAQTHGATEPQIALAFQMQRGLIVIPTSGKNERIKSNFEAANIALSAQDMTDLRALNRFERYIAPDWAPDWDI